MIRSQCASSASDKRMGWASVEVSFEQFDDGGSAACIPECRKRIVPGGHPTPHSPMTIVHHRSCGKANFLIVRIPCPSLTKRLKITTPLDQGYFIFVFFARERFLFIIDVLINQGFSRDCQIFPQCGNPMRQSHSLRLSREAALRSPMGGCRSIGRV